MTITEGEVIALLGTISSAIAALVSLKVHKISVRIEKATNGLMADRDASTATIAHAAGRAEQRAEDLTKQNKP
jgi:hypothetical protein